MQTPCEDRKTIFVYVHVKEKERNRGREREIKKDVFKLPVLPQTTP